MPSNTVNKILELLPIAPEESADLAELKYVCDSDDGFSRKKRGKGFIYLNKNGEVVKDEKILQRIKELVIPPAWLNVWICKSKNGHIQATGRDAKGRKQYIYHLKWDAIRNETKFFRLIKFAGSLPLIRETVNRDLRKQSLTKEKVIAIIIRLLEETLIRVGNAEYIANGSFGLTTLKDEHLIIDESKFQLVFKGKSGKAWEVDIHNKRLARLVKQCQDLPGQELFQYLDSEGNLHSASSSDVNRYLNEITGENFTAKDFRTWGGTIAAAKVLYEQGASESAKDEKRKITSAVKNVSKILNNTPSICRSYYIHPAIFEAYQDGTLFSMMKNVNEDSNPAAGMLSGVERSVLSILIKKLKENL